MKAKHSADPVESFCRGMNVDVNAIPLSSKINVYNANKAPRPTSFFKKDEDFKLTTGARIRAALNRTALSSKGKYATTHKFNYKLNINVKNTSKSENNYSTDFFVVFPNFFITLIPFFDILLWRALKRSESNFTLPYC